MRRVVVLGAGGFFGFAVATALRQRGVDCWSTTRAEIDAESRASLASALRPADVVVDCAGPFHRRSPTLLEVAADAGIDVVDICDDLGYAAAALAMHDRLGRAGITVFGCCSSVSTLTAMLVADSGVARPVSVATCLLPAARDTASRGTAAVLIRIAGQPIKRVHDGRLGTAVGWSEARKFVTPAGVLHGRLAESADAVNLPRVWPGLRDIDFWIDTNIPLLNQAVGAAGRLKSVRRLALRTTGAGAALARFAGSRRGAFCVEVRGADGTSSTRCIFGNSDSHMTAVLPAVLAAKALAAAPSSGRGMVPPDRQVAAELLRHELRAAGLQYAS